MALSSLPLVVTDHSVSSGTRRLTYIFNSLIGGMFALLHTFQDTVCKDAPFSRNLSPGQIEFRPLPIWWWRPCSYLRSQINPASVLKPFLSFISWRFFIFHRFDSFQSQCIFNGIKLPQFRFIHFTAMAGISIIGFIGQGSHPAGLPVIHMEYRSVPVCQLYHMTKIIILLLNRPCPEKDISTLSLIFVLSSFCFRALISLVTFHWIAYRWPSCYHIWLLSMMARSRISLTPVT